MPPVNDLSGRVGSGGLLKGHPLLAPLIPIHPDWSEIATVAALFVLRYAWKLIVWAIAPGLGRIIAGQIRKTMQPEFDSIRERLTALERRALLSPDVTET